jgi:hypothetical protein
MKSYPHTVGLVTYYYNEKNELHRDDGPAIEHADGYKEWWLNGKLHRTDGPAVEDTRGNKYWWINHKMLTEEEEFKRLTTRLGKALYL